VDQLAQTNPDDHAVLSALAWREFGRNTPEGNEKAMGYLDRAIQMGSLAPLDYEKLAELLRQAGRPVEAIAILRKGIGVNPYSQRLYKALALVYISEKLYKDAMDAMQKELEIFPEDSFMRMLLAKARATPIP
jgi:tetratricopeptide (TPR) repeat protein